jgi:hypothetical protein
MTGSSTIKPANVARITTDEAIVALIMFSNLLPFCVMVAGPNSLTGSPQAAGFPCYQLDLLCWSNCIVGYVGYVGYVGFVI